MIFRVSRETLSENNDSAPFKDTAPTHAHYRLGITIKRKCTSVERVRLKRMTREAFRKNINVLGAFDYNVVFSGNEPLTFIWFQRASGYMDQFMKNPQFRENQVKERRVKG